eukprot:XP_014790852.1 PREDICTED: uncharacterized protein LOC106884134 [Octopus bimaculoides]
MVNGQLYETYRESCHRQGLLENDSHLDDLLIEAAVSSSPTQLRNLFAIMLRTGHLSNPKQLQENYMHEHKHVLNRAQKENPNLDLQLNDNILNKTLILLENKLHQKFLSYLQMFHLNLRCFSFHLN